MKKKLQGILYSIFLFFSLLTPRIVQAGDSGAFVGTGWDIIRMYIYIFIGLYIGAIIIAPFLFFHQWKIHDKQKKGFRSFLFVCFILSSLYLLYFIASLFIDLDFF
jgi:hypothetical protein